MSPVVINNSNSAPGIDPDNYTLELIRVRERQVSGLDNSAQKEDRRLEKSEDPDSSPTAYVQLRLFDDEANPNEAS